MEVDIKIEVKDNNVEQALRVLKRKLQRDGFFKIIKLKNIPVPSFKVPSGKDLSTQEAFGRILNDLGREKSEFSDRIVTTTPDVTVTTNMAGWVNQRGLFHREEMMDLFREEKVRQGEYGLYMDNLSQILTSKSFVFRHIRFTKND